MKSKIQKHYKDTKEFFDEVALDRAGYYNQKKSASYKTQQLVRNIVLTLMKGNGAKYNKILDAGCGNGDFSILLSQQFSASKITGADYSNDMIKVCVQAKKGRDNIEFVATDLLDTPFDDTAFDITVCINVIHHVYKNDLDKLIKEIARITKKTVIIEIKNRISWYYPIKKLKSRLLLSGITVYGTTVKAMEKLFGRGGFELTSVTPLFKFAILSPIVVLKFERRGVILN